MQFLAFFAIFDVKIDTFLSDSNQLFQYFWPFQTFLRGQTDAAALVATAGSNPYLAHQNAH